MIKLLGDHLRDTVKVEVSAVTAFNFPILVTEFQVYFKIRHIADDAIAFFARTYRKLACLIIKDYLAVAFT